MAIIISAQAINVVKARVKVSIRRVLVVYRISLISIRNNTIIDISGNLCDICFAEDSSSP